MRARMSYQRPAAKRGRDAPTGDACCHASLTNSSTGRCCQCALRATTGRVLLPARAIFALADGDNDRLPRRPQRQFPRRRERHRQRCMTAFRGAPRQDVVAFSRRGEPDARLLIIARHTRWRHIAQADTGRQRSMSAASARRQGPAVAAFALPCRVGGDVARRGAAMPYASRRCHAPLPCAIPRPNSRAADAGGRKISRYCRAARAPRPQDERMPPPVRHARYIIAIDVRKRPDWGRRR